MGVPCQLFTKLNTKSKEKGYNPFLESLAGIGRGSAFLNIDRVGVLDHMNQWWTRRQYTRTHTQSCAIYCNLIYQILTLRLTVLLTPDPHKHATFTVTSFLSRDIPQDYMVVVVVDFDVCFSSPCATTNVKANDETLSLEPTPRPGFDTVKSCLRKLRILNPRSFVIEEVSWANTSYLAMWTSNFVVGGIGEFLIESVLVKLGFQLAAYEHPWFHWQEKTSKTKMRMT